MKKLLLILICLFVSFEVKSESDEEIYENFKKNEKEFYETLISNSEMLFEGGFEKIKVRGYVIEKLMWGIIPQNKNSIRLKKTYSDSQKNKILNIVTEKIFQEPKISFAYFKFKDRDFKVKLQNMIEKDFEELSLNENQLVDTVLRHLNDKKIGSKYNLKKLNGDYSDEQKKNISEILVQDFFKQRKQDKKYYACMSKYSKGQMEAFEVGIIGESCKMLLSNDKKKQKRGKCTLKEIGKHSQMVLSLKYENCKYQNE
jgi:hypothetical protein